MPSIYAHYKAGQLLKEELSENSISIINKHEDLFTLGLLGPDILFYYKPLHINKINLLGTAIHNQSGADFFDNAVNTVNSVKNNSAYLAYMYGVISHFVLDSLSHKYINSVTHEKNICHAEIESEFDRALLIHDRINLLLFNLEKYLDISERNAKIISGFYPDCSAEDIWLSLRETVKNYNRLKMIEKTGLHSIDAIIRYTLNYKQLHGLFLNYKRNGACSDINMTLYKKLKNAAHISSVIINKFCESNSFSKYNYLFEWNFNGCHKDKNYTFFSNSKCEYFPCHKNADPDNFNCLFCYCPLYILGDKCGGNFTYTKKGYKNCTNCQYPHDPKNYSNITKRYSEIINAVNYPPPKGSGIEKAQVD